MVLQEVLSESLLRDRGGLCGSFKGLCSRVPELLYLCRIDVFSSVSTFIFVQEAGETALHYCVRTADHSSLHLVDFLVQNRYETLCVFSS